VYNRSDYLAEAIESVLAQTFTRRELLIVDDGSDTEDCRRIAESYCERHARIRYMYERHGGASKARNHGIAASRGKYLAFLDSDDRYLPQGLTVLYQFMQTTADSVKLIYADFIKYFQREKRYQPTRVQPPLSRPGLYFQFLIPGCNPIAPCACLLERRILDEIGEFALRYPFIEDRQLWSRLVQSFDIAHVSQSVAIYRKHDNQKTHARNCMQLRFANDQHVNEFFFSLPLERWFPQAHDAKSQAKALEQLALLLLKQPNPPVDAALQMLRLAQQRCATQQRQSLVIDLETKIPQFLSEQYGSNERIPIENS